LVALSGDHLPPASVWFDDSLGAQGGKEWDELGKKLDFRLDDTARPCVLILMGALENGVKELIAVVDGERESKLSWQALLSDLKKRGLAQGPKLAIAKCHHHRRIY
jgi:hypothetical protein